MRILSFNANGIRSAVSKGFFSWVKDQDVDVICIQETKAQAHQLTADDFKLAGYDARFFDAQKKGYSGVAIYTRHQPHQVTTGLGFEIADTEGRYIQADFESLSIVSAYLPSGSSSPERQEIKFSFLAEFKKKLVEIMQSQRSYILCGDWNIAHKQIDLKNWRSNQKNSGFLPEERAWLDEVVELGFIDAFRVRNTNAEEYTWWSNRGQARAKNVGWRIDYQIVTPDLKDKIQNVHVFREKFFSDHAPLIIDYDFAL